MKRRGFTLVELLVALAIIGMLFVAMNTFLFSMGELWGRGGEQHLFEQHTRNATRFLESSIRAAALPPANSDGKAFSVDDVRDQSGRSNTLVTFMLPAGNRLCEWPDRPLPEVVCALTVRRGEGLFLLWHSKLEKRFEDDAPRETLVSPWVSDLAYQYFDDDLKSWKEESTPRKGASGKVEVPDRLKLTFSYDGQSLVTYVLIPGTQQGLPRL